MSKDSKIISLLVVLLIILVAAIGLIFIAEKHDNKKAYEHYDKKHEKEDVSEDLVLIESYSDKVVGSQKTVLVNDKFVGIIEEDALVVAIDSSGDAYVVQRGTVLASDMVISSTDEGYSIQRLNDRRSSVSSN